MNVQFLKKLLVILSWAFILTLSIYFYYRNLSTFFSPERSAHEESEKWWLAVHFFGAACTLFLGPIQFWPYVRNNYKKYHRFAGKLYIGGSIISALMVFYLLSNYPLPGSIPSLGFLAVIWLFTTIVAYWYAVRKNFKLHKQFMIRSYVCGMAFVFIRLLPIINSGTGIFSFIKDEEMRSTVYEWICWVYPLLITEFLLAWWPSLMKYKTVRK